MDSSPRPGEIYFEFIVNGAYVKAVAIDASTGTEVSIVAPRNTSQDRLENLALKKLLYVLSRNKDHPERAKRRPGWFV